MSVFVQAQGIKTVHTRGVKNAKILSTQLLIAPLLYNILNKVLVSGSDGEFVPINIEDIAEVVEVDEDGSTYRTFLKEGSTDPILGTQTHRSE